MVATTMHMDCESLLDLGCSIARCLESRLEATMKYNQRRLSCVKRAKLIVVKTISYVQDPDDCAELADNKMNRIRGRPLGVDGDKSHTWVGQVLQQLGMFEWLYNSCSTVCCCFCLPACLLVCLGVAAAAAAAAAVSSLVGLGLTSHLFGDFCC